MSRDGEYLIVKAVEWDKVAGLNFILTEDLTSVSLDIRGLATEAERHADT